MSHINRNYGLCDQVLLVDGAPEIPSTPGFRDSGPEFEAQQHYRIEVGRIEAVDGVKCISAEVQQKVIAAYERTNDLHYRWGKTKRGGEESANERQNGL